MPFIQSTEDLLDTYTQLEDSVNDAQARVDKLTALLATAAADLVIFEALLDAQQVLIEAAVP